MPRPTMECSANPDADIEIGPVGALRHDNLHAIITSRRKDTKS